MANTQTGEVLEPNNWRMLSATANISLASEAGQPSNDLLPTCNNSGWACLPNALNYLQVQVGEDQHNVGLPREGWYSYLSDTRLPKHSSLLNYEEVCISKVLAEVKTVEVWSMKCGSVAVRQYGSMRSDPAPWSAGCLPDCLIWTKPTGEHLEEEDLDKRYKKNIKNIAWNEPANWSPPTWCGWSW